MILLFENLSLLFCCSYEEGGAKYWHNFYKRNTDNFYKDRHYLHLVFPELDAKDETNMNKNTSCHLLEVGCGVGNAGKFYQIVV